MENLSTCFPSPDSNPALVLCVQTDQQQNIELVVESISDGFRSFFGLQDTAEAEELRARSLFPHDQIVVDEWVTFLLKARMDRPHYSDKTENPVIKRSLLQFWQATKGWVIAELAYHTGDGRVEVAFFQPGESELAVSVPQLMDSKQWLWLDSFVGDGGYWEIDLPSQTMFISRTLAKRLLLANEAVVVPVSRFLGLVHPDDLGKVKDALTNVKTVSAPILNRGILSDGSMVYFKSFAIPGYDGKGEMTHIIGRSQDVTEMERTVEQLSMSEQRFRSIIEHSQDMFVVLNPEGNITYISPNVRDITGYWPADTLGQPFRSFIAFPEKDDARMWGEFVDVLRGKRMSEGEYRIRRADGSAVWFLVRISAVLDAKGDIAEIVAVCSDITERKQREDELRYMGLHDALTGVYNRFYFERELERVQRDSVVNFGLVITDLNGLKLVNDAFGHQVGDQILVETAKLLSGLDEGKHAVARIGGDEFAVFVSDCSEHDLELVCESIDIACKNTAAEAVPLSISWGAVHRAHESESVQALFKQAEGRMYNNKLLDSRSMHNQVLASLKETLKSRNVETADHMQRMENMVMALGKRLGLPGSEFDRLVLLATMHDIGKVAIPDNVINKEGPLSDEEWEVMRTHSEVGCRIAMTSQELSCIANEIGCHHERWDGKGYPYGHMGNQIPLLSRIISVVDAYDVMTHKRVYKDAIDHEAAIGELQRCAGTQFDPQIVEFFLDLFGSLSEKEMRSFMYSDATVNREAYRNKELLPPDSFTG